MTSCIIKSYYKNLFLVFPTLFLHLRPPGLVLYSSLCLQFSTFLKFLVTFGLFFFLRVCFIFFSYFLKKELFFFFLGGGGGGLINDYSLIINFFLLFIL